MDVKQTDKRGIFSWCMLAWANSAFITVIAGFVFGPYFIHQVAHDVIQGTVDWSWAIATVGIIVAFTAPLLGALVDQKRRRKPWLAVLTTIVVTCTALLYFTQPNAHWIAWGLTLFVFAGVAFELAQVIYNAMLYTLAPKDYIGRISGWGWSFIYFGGITCLSVALLLFIQGHFFSTAHENNIRLITLFSALWVGFFSLPLFFFTKDLPERKITSIKALQRGFIALLINFRYLRHNKAVFFYLIANLIYTDGLNTLLAYSAIYASGTFHMQIKEVIMLAISVNLTAGLGAIIFAWVDDKIGSKFVICLSLIVLAATVIGMLITHSVIIFWVLALVGGIFLGPSQASSRSYMVRITPEHLATQLFGFYALSGRVTAFIGPFLVGLLTKLYQSQRVGLFAPELMLLLGLAFMLFLPRHQKSPSQIQD